MALICNRWVEDWLVELVREVSGANGVPPYIVMGIVLAESGGNPFACGGCTADPRALFCPPSFGSTCSGGRACWWGLLQLSVCGGQGDGHSLEELIDPRRNLEIGVPPIADAYRGWGEDYCCILVTSGHPAQLPTCDRSWCGRPDLQYFIRFIECARRDFPGPPPPGATTIEGRVRDSIDGAPIPSASILLDTDQRTATDEEGYYRLQGVPAGTRTIWARHLLYRETQQTVVVQGGELLRVDLALTPLGVVGPPPAGAGGALLLMALLVGGVSYAAYGPIGLLKAKKFL